MPRIRSPAWCTKTWTLQFAHNTSWKQTTESVTQKALQFKVEYESFFIMWPRVRACKQGIFRCFLLVFGLFDFGTFQPFKQQKSWKISSPKKGKISINFGNFCANLDANFLNFSKHSLHFQLGCFWRELLTKKKLKMRKFVNFSQPWNFTFFGDDIFQLFYCLGKGSKKKVWKFPYFCWH